MYSIYLYYNYQTHRDWICLLFLYDTTQNSLLQKVKCVYLYPKWQQWIRLDILILNATENIKIILQLIPLQNRTQCSNLVSYSQVLLPREWALYLENLQRQTCGRIPLRAHLVPLLRSAWLLILYVFTGEAQNPKGSSLFTIKLHPVVAAFQVITWPW